jgi:hypothetical protein
MRTKYLRETGQKDWYNMLYLLHGQKYTCTYVKNMI